MNKYRIKKIVLIVITVFGVGLVATGSYAWNMFTSAITNIQEEIDNNEREKRLEQINLAEGDPITILLMGIDEPEDEGDPYQRSDTLIFLTLNPQTQSTHMVSIPRDTYTDIVGHGKKDKINHSYAFGGTDMTLRTVENFLDVPVDYFIRMNMNGFEDLVNAVGGIEVDNDFKFKYKGVTYEEGPIHLDGYEALHYSRMRKQDPRGDFGRNERQREVIQAIVDKGTTMTGITSSISNFGEIIGVIEDNVRTNLSLENMWDIQSNYQDALNNVVEHEISGTETEINETYYFMADEEEVKNISEELKKQLDKQSK
ncbi:LCP family glycopolymer transferase [Oceanobacillus saliphilus]|uniref:LCP family glycopolymer transferase n=1 Tax=Oceanobacillus saliphilus TaxID=2925834 RepID=UPI00201E5152|nr:LCP family protein [Oceanobacillus saliphilus]